MPETYTAKQVATRIGTDPKTLRKFLRSKDSPYEAVGQGGRYEFPRKDLTVIKKAFTAWQSGKRPSTVPPKSTPAQKPADPDSARRNREKQLLEKHQLPNGAIDDVSGLAQELLDNGWLPGDDEPSEDDLAAIDDEDFDLDIEED